MSINDDLTPEQQADLEEWRAELSTPEAMAEEDRLRAAILAERMTPEGRARDLRALAEVEAIEAIACEVPVPTLAPETAEAMARFRLARERQGLSLGDLAERTKINEAALSRLERGQGNPTIATLNRIAEALGLRLELNLVEAG